MMQTTANFETRGSQTRRAAMLLRQGISAHGIFWCIIIAFYVCYMILHYLRPDLVTTNVLKGALIVFLGCAPVVGLCIVVMRVYHVIVHVRPKHPTIGIPKGVAEFFVNPKRWANGLPMMVVMVFFAYMFADIQGKIVLINPVLWDVDFAALDKALHFGKHPWEWLQPIFGFQLATSLINLNYVMWFFVMWTFFVHFGFQEERSELRTQFFLSFILTWLVGGIIMATFLATGGPCYFSRFGFSPDPYVDLMAYLRQVDTIYPVWAIRLQDIVWKGHLNGVPLSEISAMPSMHNATTLLFIVAGFRIGRFWGWLMCVHALFIFIGSFMLAWHYAVDSYVAWPVAYVIWLAMAPVARWWHSTAAQKDFDESLALT